MTIFALRALGVSGGRLSSSVPASLLAALVSLTILLRSVGRILLCGMETRGISKLTSITNFQTLLFRPVSCHLVLHAPREELNGTTLHSLFFRQIE